MFYAYWTGSAESKPNLGVLQHAQIKARTSTAYTTCPTNPQQQHRSKQWSLSMRWILARRTWVLDHKSPCGGAAWRRHRAGDVVMVSGTGSGRSHRPQFDHVTTWRVDAADPAVGRTQRGRSVEGWVVQPAVLSTDLPSTASRPGTDRPPSGQREVVQGEVDTLTSTCCNHPRLHWVIARAVWRVVVIARGGLRAAVGGDDETSRQRDVDVRVDLTELTWCRFHYTFTVTAHASLLFCHPKITHILSSASTDRIIRIL